MSLIRSDGTKIVPDRTGPDAFWSALDREFNQHDRITWKYLAMLSLRENADWPVERIGRAFGHTKGYVTRCLRQIKQEICRRFRADDLWSHPDQPPPSRDDA